MNATVIVAAIAGATGLTVVTNLLNSTNSFKPVIGGFVVGTALLALALFNTPIAGALSLLILAAALFKSAPVLMARIDYMMGNN